MQSQSLQTRGLRNKEPQKYVESAGGSWQIIRDTSCASAAITWLITWLKKRILRPS